MQARKGKPCQQHLRAGHHLAEALRGAERAMQQDQRFAVAVAFVLQVHAVHLAYLSRAAAAAPTPNPMMMPATVGISAERRDELKDAKRADPQS
jgi:hypothetical protein